MNKRTRSAVNGDNSSETSIEDKCKETTESIRDYLKSFEAEWKAYEESFCDKASLEINRVLTEANTLRDKARLSSAAATNKVKALTEELENAKSGEESLKEDLSKAENNATEANHKLEETKKAARVEVEKGKEELTRLLNAGNAFLECRVRDEKQVLEQLASFAERFFHK